MWVQTSSNSPCACRSPPLFPKHTSSSLGPSRERPWTRADLAASPRPDVIRLSRKEKGWKSTRIPSRFRLVLGALSRGWGEQIELSEGVWLLRVRVWYVMFAGVQALVVRATTWHKTWLSERHGRWHLESSAQRRASMPQGIVFSRGLLWVLMGRALWSDCKEVIALWRKPQRPARTIRNMCFWVTGAQLRVW